MRDARLRAGVAWLLVAAALANPGPGGQALADPQEAGADPEDKQPAAGARPRAAGKEKGSKGPDLKGLTWLPLEQGLYRLRDKKLPALVMYQAPAQVPLRKAAEPAGKAEEAQAAPLVDVEVLLAEHASDSAMREVLKRYVLIRLEPADLGKPYPDPLPPAGPAGSDKQARGAAAGGKQERGKGGKASGKESAGSPEPAGGGRAPPAADAPGGGPTVAVKLGLVEDRSHLVVLSFREEDVKRYVGELPSRSRLKDELKRISRINDYFVQTVRRVEPELEKARYAFRLGNTREAVLKVRDFEDKTWEGRMDPVLRRRVSEVVQELRAKAEEAIKAADKLDANKQYEEAIKAFDAVIKDFPFSDVGVRCQKRKGEILRKLTVGF